MSVAHYEQYAEDGTVVVHVGFEIRDQNFVGAEEVKAMTAAICMPRTT